MLRLFPYRIRLVRAIKAQASRPHRGGYGRGTRVAAVLLPIGLAAAPLMPVSASTTAPFTASIPTVTYGVTVNPSSGTYGSCTGGTSGPNALGFPNGVCVLTGLTVTNTSTAGMAHIAVQGSDAVPSDAGKAWVLVPTPIPPGVDQINESVQPVPNTLNELLSLGTECDQAFNPANTADQCAATPNQSSAEQLSITGPSSSTDPSPLFTTTITWFAFQ